MSILQLIRHPACADQVRGISAGLERSAGGLRITYILLGDLSGCVIPLAGPARRGDKLWQHTCFELFVSPDLPAYREFNFSPSGEWAAYAFSGYRQAIDAPIATPSLSVRRGADRLELEAMIPVIATSRVSVALSAVIEGKPGVLSYWALKHPPGKPDFHHADGFAFEL